MELLKTDNERKNKKKICCMSGKVMVAKGGQACGVNPSRTDNGRLNSVHSAVEQGQVEKTRNMR